MHKSKIKRMPLWLVAKMWKLVVGCWWWCGETTAAQTTTKSPEICFSVSIDIIFRGSGVASIVTECNNGCDHWKTNLTIIDSEAMTIITVF
jgi:hypothetical protein